MKTKIIATLLTAITLLTSVAPVLAAYDLGDYPNFLFEDHNLDAYVVAGADAKPADVVGMTDLAVRLAGESYEEISAGDLEVSGGKKEEVPLDTALNAAGYFGSTLDDNDLPGLLDTQLSITTSDGTEEYDIHEEVQLTSSISVETGLTTANTDEDFLDNVFLEVYKGSVKYCYEFDDELDSGYFLNDTSSSYPLELEFLGDSLTITGATESSITAQIGDKQLLKAGESVTISGKTVTLQSTTTSKAVVSCSGTTKTVAEGSSVTLCGLEVVLDTLIDDEGTENDQAILIIGEEAEKTYNDGEEYIGQDEDDPDWVWDLSGLNTADNINLCVEYDQNLDEADEVIVMGEKLCLPGNYACIDLNSFVEKERQDYEIEATTEELFQTDGSTTRLTTGYIIHWESKGGNDDGFSVPLAAGGAEDADDIALYFNATKLDIEIYYKDPDNNHYTYTGNDIVNGTTGGNQFYFTYGDTNLPMYFAWNAAGTTGNMTFNTSAGDPLKILFETNNNRFEYLGGGDSDTSSDYDLMYGNQAISGWEEDTMTETGIIIYDPDSTTSGDTFTFSISGDESDFTVNVIIVGPGGATTTTGGDFIKKVVPVTNAVAKLDTEISLPVNKNLILVGGSAVNRLTAQAMGLTYPTYGGSGLLPFGQGEGYIKVYEDVLETGKVAVVVAGWEAADTRNAASVLQKYTEFATELDGNVAVKVTSVTAAGISPST